MTADHNSLVEELRALARGVRQLSPSRTRPEEWHISKDAIAKALQRLAHQLENRSYTQ